MVALKNIFLHFKIFKTPDLVLPAYPYLLFQDSPGTKPLSYPPPAVQFYISIPQVVSPPFSLVPGGIPIFE